MQICFTKHKKKATYTICMIMRKTTVPSCHPNDTNKQICPNIYTIPTPFSFRIRCVIYFFIHKYATSWFFFHASLRANTRELMIHLWRDGKLKWVSRWTCGATISFIDFWMDLFYVAQMQVGMNSYFFYNIYFLQITQVKLWSLKRSVINSVLTTLLIVNTFKCLQLNSFLSDFMRCWEIISYSWNNNNNKLFIFLIYSN